MVRRFALFYGHGAVTHNHIAGRMTFEGDITAGLGRCYRALGGRRGGLGGMAGSHTCTGEGTIVRRSDSILGCRVPDDDDVSSDGAFASTTYAAGCDAFTFVVERFHRL